VTRLLRATVHAPALSRIALLGRNFADAEAIDAGLADEVAEAEGFEATCLARLEEYAEKDPQALAVTKAWLREGVLAEMIAHESERLAAFLDSWFSEGTRQRIRATVASLQSKA
jgi:enoyl-CoA hydratase/carnithine racemase